MIGLLNYGLGNIKAFSNILKNLNVNFIIPENENDLKSCQKFILPGVGSFDEAVHNLKSKNYFNYLREEITKNKKKILGICVGMQIFLNKSEEGKQPGLGWVDGEVIKFDNSDLRVPHIGWNKIINLKKNKYFDEIDNSEFYFLHSYYCKLENKNEVICNTNYTKDFCSAYQSDNIFGIQFHPEKSHENGIRLINNFLKK